MNRSDWEKKALQPALRRDPERRKEFHTTSGIPVERLASPETLGEFDVDAELGYPGAFPFVRGVQPTMYRGRHWTMRQYAGFGTASDSNARYHDLLNAGTTGLSVAFDLPTQMGYDSDHPMAMGEVGRVGVAVDSLEDMEVLFRGIPLERVSTSMTINSTASVLLAFYVALAQRRGISPSKLKGTVQNDILKEYIARGTYIFPPRPSMRIVTDMFAWCQEHVPLWNTISISGYHIREAGATAVQELAFTLADAIAYVDAALAAGLNVDDFAPRLSFFFNAHNDFFEEIAKFRAARRLWATLMRDRYGSKSARSMKMRFHTQTSGATLQAQQPLNNIVRVALQAFAAVMGGTQSLHTNAFDEALGLPTTESATLALRTQQIIAHESGTVDTIDPLAGSWYVAGLTREVENRVLDYLQRIESMGGAVAAIESRYFQGEIEESAYRYQQAVESGERVVVGVNRFAEQDPVSPPVTRIDPRVGQEQSERLQELRARRNSEGVEGALERVENCARSGDNLMPVILAAAEELASLGEICDRLRAVFGSFD
jgi:methylmalonyl-CoA mutase N-terminal domain/subunit